MTDLCNGTHLTMCVSSDDLANVFGYTQHEKLSAIPMQKMQLLLLHIHWVLFLKILNIIWNVLPIIWVM